MKFSLTLRLSLLVATSLSLGALAQNSTDSCCKFTISSSLSFPSPAGQLDDGQIRFNGTYPTANFCLGSDGGITDDKGRGCIVTGAPTTQIQCDINKPPTTGFSIGADNALSYQGITQFYACPATDTEYNIYVSPNFNQTKCFPITLAASSGCGLASCSAPTVTVWQREWVTETVPITATYTYTTVTSVTSTCSAGGSSGWNSSISSLSSTSGGNTSSSSVTLSTSVDSVSSTSSALSAAEVTAAK